MHEDLYTHPLIKPLLESGPEVPVPAIEALAKEMKRKKTLARKCNTLFRFEASFNTAQDNYLTVWLAFSLALSRDENAISNFIDLFELVDPIEYDMLWELAQFSLWQYGDKAVREVLKNFWHVLEVDHTGYYLGVLEVVGISGDQLLRRRVADCVIKALQSQRTSPTALMGLVDIAMILEDKRLPLILEHWKSRLPQEDRNTLEEAEQILFSSDPEMRNDEFRLPWQELAEFSADHFSIHLETVGHLPGLESEPESLEEEFTELAESFQRSARFLDIPKKWRSRPDEVIHLLTSIFNHLYEDLGVLPDEADIKEVSTLMTEVLPGKMVAEADSFKPIPPVLIAFFKFLTDGYSKDEGNDFAAAIKAAKEEMLKRAADPTCWDGFKSRAMGGDDGKK